MYNGKLHLYTQYLWGLIIIGFSSYCSYAFHLVHVRGISESATKYTDLLLLFIIFFSPNIFRIWINIHHISKFYKKNVDLYRYDWFNMTNIFPDVIIIKMPALLCFILSIFIANTILTTTSKDCPIDCGNGCKHVCICFEIITYSLLILCLLLATCVCVMFISYSVRHIDELHVFDFTYHQLKNIFWYHKTRVDLLYIPETSIFITTTTILNNIIIENGNENANANANRNDSLMNETIRLLPVDKTPPNDNICAICVIESINGDTWKILPCKHRFHPKCIDPWLSMSNTCPICRKLIQT